MIIQTSQIGQIEVLEDEVWTLKEKVVAQDIIISDLVSDCQGHSAS